LHRSDLGIRQHGVELLGHKLRRYGLDARDAATVLHRQRDGNGAPLDAEGLERLEVRLEAGAAARVGAGDAQHERSRQTGTSGSGVRTTPRVGLLALACARTGMRPARWAARPARTASRNADAMRTGSLASAIPVFTSTASAPISRHAAASL